MIFISLSLSLSHHLPATILVSMLASESLFQMVDAQLQPKILLLHVPKHLRGDKTKQIALLSGYIFASIGAKLTISWSFMVLVLWGDMRPALVRFGKVPVSDIQRACTHVSMHVKCVYACMHVDSVIYGTPEVCNEIMDAFWHHYIGLICRIGRNHITMKQPLMEAC